MTPRSLGKVPATAKTKKQAHWCALCQRGKRAWRVHQEDWPAGDFQSVASLSTAQKDSRSDMNKRILLHKTGCAPLRFWDPLVHVYGESFSFFLFLKKQTNKQNNPTVRKGFRPRSINKLVYGSCVDAEAQCIRSWRLSKRNACRCNVSAKSAVFHNASCRSG
jgi:hypothetical protein